MLRSLTELDGVTCLPSKVNLWKSLQHLEISLSIIITLSVSHECNFFIATLVFSEPLGVQVKWHQSG